MKNKFLTLVLLVSGLVVSAQTRSDIFKSSTPVTWLGVDFSAAKLIGDRERLGSQSDVLHLFDKINQLIVNEPDKYNIAKAIGRTEVEKSINVTSEHNANLDVNEMFSEQSKDHNHLKIDDIREIVSSYDYKDVSGLGLMFNVDSFSKFDEDAAIWITFINIDSKEVLFTQRLNGKPKGFGLRNFWGGAIYSIIEQIKKKEFEAWRKKSS